jgi:hypothetical protein
MTEVFNYHGLLLNQTSSAFINRLEIDSRTESALNTAASAVKDRLTPVLRQVAEKFGVKGPYSTPRYRLQGSAVYRTQNAPAHPPQQQVDQDLGVYISASFLESAADSSQRKLPAAALAKTYFEIVDKELRQLCRERGWEYAEGHKQNDRCCRINLATTGVDAHIDVPLYAAPDEEFERAMFAEATARAAVSFAAADSADRAREIDEVGWDQLEVVVMACRNGTWVESDVQKTIRHFRNAADSSGHPRVIRRLWRFVKSWRDFIWKSGGPSSILLMEIVQRICAELHRGGSDVLGDGRDDQMVRQVFPRMAHYLQREVIVHWGREAEDLNRGAPEEREAWASEAVRAASSLQRAACEASLNCDQVISLVRSVFGQRIPSDVTLIKMNRTAVSSLYGGIGPAIQPQPQARIQRTSGA